jgi:protein tyrosine phosphatase
MEFVSKSKSQTMAFIDIEVEDNNEKIVLDNEFIELCKNTKKVLTPLDEITKEKYMGPLPESNKVIDGLYAGAFPGDIIDRVNDECLITLLNSGITMLVCMQEEYNNNATDYEWRFLDKYKRPYYKDIQRILQNKEQYSSLNTDIKSVKFLHFPIKDLDIISDIDTLEAANSVVKALEDGEIIYLHCWGGHGRTGVIVCLVLHLLFNLSAQEAFTYCQYVHAMRVYELPVRSPQSYEQCEQVRRIISNLTKL